MNYNAPDKKLSQRDAPIYAEQGRGEAPLSGPAIAAMLAPVLGFLAMMISHHVARASKELDKLVHSYGHWIPGSVGSGPDGSIGSYSGKETMALIVWAASWLILHLLWRKRDLSLGRWVPVFLGVLAVATLGFFHPVADPVVVVVTKALGGGQ